MPDTMTREEWIARCKARLLAGGTSEWWANLHPAALADEQAELHGASGMAWESPEDAADAHLAEEDPNTGDMFGGGHG